MGMKESMGWFKMARYLISGALFCLLVGLIISGVGVPLSIGVIAIMMLLLVAGKKLDLFFSKITKK